MFQNWRDTDRYLAVFAITLVMCIGELIGSILSGSLALGSDALHAFLDLFSVAIALWCECRAVQQGMSEHHRPVSGAGKEIDFRALGALLNSILLIFGALVIAFEAAQRIFHPPEITASIMLLLAIVGLGANSVCVLILRPKNGAHLNKKALFLHALSDGMHSFLVLIAGLIIAVTGWFVVDPLISFILAAFMFFWGTKLLQESWRLMRPPQLF